MKMLRFFLYSFLFLVIIVLLYLYIRPGGQAIYTHYFSKNHYNFFGGKGFFHKFGPAERLLDKNKVINDPLYFYLDLPRSFSQAQVKLDYQLSPKLQASKEYLDISLGVLVDEKNWHYDLQPIFNSILRQLENDENFNVSREGDLFFAQRKGVKNFSNIQAFLDEGNYQEALFYNYFPLYDFKLEKKSSIRVDKKNIVQNLRGSHIFYTYIDNNPLKIDFSWHLKDSLNKQVIGENFDLFVYYQDEEIFSEKIKIEPGEEKSYELKLDNLVSGAYKIEIRGSDNLISDKIETNLSKLSFLNKVHLDSQTNGFTLFSNKNNFRLKSFSSDCLGEVKVGEESIKVDKIFQQFNFSTKAIKNNNKLNKIESASGGLLLENNGLFAFSEEAFFNPLLNKLDADSDLADYNYVIAKYREAEAEFNLEAALYNKGAYRFLLSAPFLSEGQEDFYIELEKIEIKLSGRTLWSKIGSLLKK